MLKKILEKQVEWVEKKPKLKKFAPLVRAIDTFCFEPKINTKHPPFIRDAVDLKRWMIIVVFALIPCTIMAIWNSGVQAYVYSSGNYLLMKEFIEASSSFSGYFSFISENGRIVSIITEGLLSFLPVLLISYAVGGLWEFIFATVKGHEISEGFLVSGLLYPLILPPSLPYWMVAVGVSLGIVIGKEVFGGTGMNILNPALTCRTFLYFGFPAYMTGEVWAGRDNYTVSQSIIQMNNQANLSGADAISQETSLAIFNLPGEVKRIHIDTIANHHLGIKTEIFPYINSYFQKWSSGISDAVRNLSDLTLDQLREFVTAPFEQGGLGLAVDNFPLAEKFIQLKYGLNLFSDGNLFWGNKLGSFGEVSIFFCIIGMLLLLITKVGSFRTMFGFIIGVLATSLLASFASTTFGVDSGAWNRAVFDFPFYKHFLIGSIAFGIVFMATDPVSSPSMRSSQWMYGILIGALIIIIRTINPAYPEGVMLAILFANVFAPLFDFYNVRIYRRKKRVLL
ncbi:MAG: NADH:ubiquinone reductase (Na(+)-transporting) subunit B [Chlamydiota bacterium]|jgi:Na+-transporting NADH:ubiquinone oxidoreductase subunit B